MNNTDSLPIQVPVKDYSDLQGDGSSANLFTDLLGNFTELMTPVYGMGIKVITILFIVATLVMIMSALFKNGQWQKYGQTTMLLSFVSMLVLRGLPIVVLSVRGIEDIDIVLQEALSILRFGVIFLCLISFTVSFLFGFGYKLIEHPEFHRWAKTLRSVSVMMVIFAIAVPFLFPII